MQTVTIVVSSGSPPDAYGILLNWSEALFEIRLKMPICEVKLDT